MHPKMCVFLKHGSLMESLVRSSSETGANSADLSDHNREWPKGFLPFRRGKQRRERRMYDGGVSWNDK